MINLFKSAILNKVFKKKIPLVVNFSITNRCNFNCKYCGETKVSQKELSTEEVLSILEQMKELKTRRISFSGGEPFIRDDFEDILRHAKSSGFFVGVNSNGSLILRKESALNYVDFLALSFDGPKEIHDSLTQEGSYDGVINAVKLAKEKNVKVIFNTVINKVNIGYLNFILEKARELGIKLKFQPLNRIHSRQKEVDNLIPDKKEYKNIIKQLINLKKTDNIIYNSMSSLKYLYKWPNTKRINNCCGAQIYFRISSSGNVYPCPIKEYMTPSMNVNKEGLKRALHYLGKNWSDKGCSQCIVAGTLELNLCYKNSVSAIYNFIRNS